MDNQNPIVNARNALRASLAGAAGAANLPLNMAQIIQLVNGVDVSALFMAFAGQANRAFLMPLPLPPVALPPQVPPQGLPHMPFGHPFPALHLPPYPDHTMQILRASVQVPNSHWDFNLRGCIIFFDLISRWTDVNGRQILWAKVSGQIWYRHLKRVDNHRLKTFFLDLIRHPEEPRIIIDAPGNLYAADTEVHQFFVDTANAMWQARAEGQDFNLVWPAHWAGWI